MATHFHSLKIKALKKETTDCVSIYFDVPQNLSSEFLYKEGQNITVRKMINGEDIRRSYSICSAPHENKLKVAIKKVEGGLFSSFANDSMQQSEILEVMPPSGRFSAHLSKKENPNYLAIAAGSGITPIIAIIKHTLHTQSNSRFTLIYGSKNRSAIIFFEELEDLKNKYMERFTLINILSREKIDAEIFHGRINKIKLTALEKLVNYKKTDAAYLCGPEEMIFSSSEFLQEQGLDKNIIHFELFTTPGQISTDKKEQKADNLSSGPKSNITIRLDGRTFAFDLAYNGASILDAALQNGADLPYACKGGVCCTCRAKLLEGEVKMDVNYALEEEEVQQGFVLTCQSHPTTEKVFIDFDQK